MQERLRPACACRVQLRFLINSVAPKLCCGSGINCAHLRVGGQTRWTSPKRGCAHWQVEVLFPSVVATDNVSGHKAVDYPRLSVFLTKAVQQQEARIAQKGEQISELKNDKDQQDTKITELKAEHSKLRDDKDQQDTKIDQQDTKIDQQDTTITELKAEMVMLKRQMRDLMRSMA